MANKATRKQVMAVVERFAGADSAIHDICVRMFDDGYHANEVMMWLKTNLRASGRHDYQYVAPPITAHLSENSNGND